MNNWLNRTEQLIGSENLNKLKNSTIAIFGVGGVGSFAFEALVRAGVGNLVLIDNDVVDITNINRQLIANINNIGKQKVDVAKERALNINPNINIITYKEFFNEENSEQLLSNEYNYVVDCIDSVKSKICLIETCYNKNIPIISSMGTGNKLDPTKFEITDINKTSVCPLAKIIRKELKKKNIPDLKVVFSKEEPIKTTPTPSSTSCLGSPCPDTIRSVSPASISFVPSVAGLLLASEVVKDIIS